MNDPILWYECSAITSGAARRLRTDHQASVIAVTNRSGPNQSGRADHQQRSLS